MDNGHAKYRVAVIGSGNWGSVASRLIASNTAKLPSFYGTAHAHTSCAFSL
jgi:glycerol-3-phosphate dehydrogenase (NAD+)